MVQFNLSQREITLKVVYYGPALSGKTTNLQVVHQLLDPQCRGRLMTLDTADDRTLFFDLMPIFFRTSQGFKVKLKLYTVPGQVMHNSTRRIVLAGSDGVVFVADSQLKEAKANQDAWAGMMENLKENGIDPEQVPIVIQFNKRDLPNVRTDEEMEKLRKSSKEPIFKAVAVEGKGVMETLYATVKATFRALNARYEFERKFGLTEKEFLHSIFKNVDLQSKGINLGEELA
ncbi:MAG: MglA protein [Deltaproteobacteria bacterium]|nr:MglA protein [Deltaproteobacteria bacterium]